MKTAVITTVHGRTEHLRRQMSGLAANTRAADLHVVVAIDEPAAREAATGTDTAVVV